MSERLTDEQIDKVEKKCLSWAPRVIWQSIIQAFADLRHYKQLAEELQEGNRRIIATADVIDARNQGYIQALEQIDNIAEACGAEAHIVRKTARKALGKNE